MADRARGPAAVLAVAAGLGCAGRSSGTPAPAQAFVHDLGAATATDLEREVPEVIGRLGFNLIRVDLAPRFRFETEWRPRQPFPDEAAAGISDVDTRVVLTARPHRGVPTAAPLYAVTMTVESRGRGPGGDAWRRLALTDDSRAYARRIADRFEAELRAIVRRYGVEDGVRGGGAMGGTIRT